MQKSRKILLFWTLRFSRLIHTVYTYDFLVSWICIWSSNFWVFQAWVIIVTSSKSRLKRLIKICFPDIFKNWSHIFHFWTKNHQTNVKRSVTFATVSPKFYQIVRKLTISLNQFPRHKTEVIRKKISRLSQNTF